MTCEHYPLASLRFSGRGFRGVKTYPLELDRITGRVEIIGRRAFVLAEHCDGLPLGVAQNTLRVAVLDGRCRLPDDVSRLIDLDGPSPRVSS